MVTIEERLISLEAKSAEHDTKIKKADDLINKFKNIKKMVVRKSESGRIQLRDVDQ